MKKHFLIIAVLFQFSCYSQENLDFLNRAYFDNSLYDLQKFFDSWADKNTFKNYENENYFIKNANELYCLFYKYKKEPNIDTALKKGNYFIIPNRLDIFQVNTDSFDLSFSIKPEDSLIILKDSIIDYRPNINLKNTKFLYLTDELENILYNFLEIKNKPVGFYKTYKFHNINDLKFDRCKFLNNYVSVWLGHWIGWDLATFPIIFSITFNKKNKLAVIKYKRGFNSGGEAIYEYNSDKWSLVIDRKTWIE